MDRLIAINALSLVSALVANTSLLLNMARRVKFSIAQPITIAGFLLSAVLLISDLAALTASHTYRIPIGDVAAPAARHSLSSAFYYGIMAACIYTIIAALMCVTVYGANNGHYEKEFRLTVAQRTLMLQTMAFFAYLLLGALVFSKVEGWQYLDAVYWADTTLLTVGTGDYSPSTHTGRSLLFPFAIGGIVIIGLVIGSIRTLVLERGKEKLSARITEKKREKTTNTLHPENRKVRVGWFKRVEFPESASPTEKRRREFQIMRVVQDTAEEQRRWIALMISTTLALALWFVGAAVFKVAERNQQWSYFQSLYFCYISLLTIGYGDFTPLSNSGRPFFVFWSLLAVPALTVLISNMGDTVIKGFSDLSIWIGSITVLPGERGVRATVKTATKQFASNKLNKHEFNKTQPPGALGDSAMRTTGTEDDSAKDPMTDEIADRIAAHLEEEEIHEAEEAEAAGDELERDIHFYHFVLAREVRNLMKDLSASPPKRYEWEQWEYFLKLMGEDKYDIDGDGIPDRMIPPELELPDEGTKWASREERFKSWSWLSEKSPLMGTQTEAEWILERLSATLERELKEARHAGKTGREDRKRPPISMAEMKRRGREKSRQEERSGSEETEETEDSEKTAAVSDKSSDDKKEAKESL